MKFTIREILLITLLFAVPLAIGHYSPHDGIAIAFLPFAWCGWRLSAATSNPLLRIGLAGIAGAVAMEAIFWFHPIFLPDRNDKLVYVRIVAVFIFTWGFVLGTGVGVIAQLGQTFVNWWWPKKLLNVAAPK